MSKSPDTELLILGAGPAGLGAALHVARKGTARVTVIERGSLVGGNAGSFKLEGIPVDYGSHRLHPASDPEILKDVRELLGDELLDRPRHGRIRLLGRWIHFPLKPLDLAFRLPPTFFPGVVRDTLIRPFRSAEREGGSFASVVEAKLGSTIARDFYLPYARKIWGVAPEELSAIQARRRVSADSPLKLVRKVLNSVPGFKPPGSGRFFYPRQGFGQICEAYREAAERAGARIELSTTVSRIETGEGRPVRVICEQAGEERSFAADHVWSTIPVSILAQSLVPSAPEPVLEASRSIRFRAMLLIYLVLDQDQFTEFDAHYFPGETIKLTRLSEPKNYANLDEPRGRTVLCAELPCSTEDPEWSMNDEELGALVLDSLREAGLPAPSTVRQVVSRRLPQAYPIYLEGYERHFERIDEWLDSVPDLLSFGRQGLFAHDNTHHALFMAYSASECLDADGDFDRARWREFRKIFESHVVED